MSNLLIRDFFINICILFTGITVLHYIFRKKSVALETSIFKRTAIGFALGLFGYVIMHFGIHLQGNVQIDLRTLPIMAAAQIGGWFSTLITIFILVLARILFYPYSTAALLNVVVLFLVGTFFSLISYSKLSWNRKWLLMTVSLLIVLGSTMPIVVHGLRNIIEIFGQYAIAIVIAVYLVQIQLTNLWNKEYRIVKLNELSQTDYLTGLNNTRSFSTTFDSLFNKAKERSEPLSLLMIDIDHFKSVNDSYGHPSGDCVLKQLSTVLTKSCRTVDIVSRNGGEEFTVILPSCDVSYAEMVAERIRSNIEGQTFEIENGKTISITVSVGVATVHEYGITTAQTIIRYADEALYTAKETGRNRICYITA